MTKANELSVLDKAIAELGTDSYLGPWLRSVRAEVERDVRSDFVPMLLPSEAERLAADIIASAHADAKRLVEDACARAAALVTRANDDAAAVRSRAVRSLQDALVAVDGWR